MGNLFRRGKVYYADYVDRDGRRHRCSLRTQDSQVAKERLRERELLATNPAAYSKETLGDALENLIVSLARAGRPEGTISSYTSRAGHTVRVLGRDLRIGSLRRPVLLAYLDQRRDEGATDHSIHKELVVVRLALKHARDRETWAGDISQIVPTIRSGYTPKDRWLTHEEYRAVLRELPEQWRFWFVVACNTGMRDAELSRFSWEWIRGKTIVIQQTKPKPMKRVVPITAELEAWLWIVPDDERAGPVLADWSNRRRTMALACKRAGVERVSPNDLRRTLASWLLQSGVDVFTVSRILGHKSTRMVEAVYGHLCERNFAQAVGALDGCVAGGAPAIQESSIPGSPCHSVAGQIARDISGDGVPRDGIEPSTRGFSGGMVRPTEPRTLRVIAGGRR